LITSFISIKKYKKPKTWTRDQNIIEEQTIFLTTYVGSLNTASDLHTRTIDLAYKTTTTTTTTTKQNATVYQHPVQELKLLDGEAKHHIKVTWKRKH
jgi:predicted patatin/cPLA2 family phospholipase